MTSAEPIEITIFRKSGGPLTKRIELGPDGQVKSDGSQCVMPRGVARRFTFSAAAMQELASAIDRFGPDEALATGAIRPDLPDIVEVVTKRQLNGATHPDVIARTQEFICFTAGRPAIALIDFDAKGMPRAVVDRLEELGGVGPALLSIVPELEHTARIERASTSAGLYDERNGEMLPASVGRHFYPVIKDGTDSERFLKTLHERCWLGGFGWMMVGAGGQLLERSIVDRVCGTPERLAFEGRPVVISPLAQDLALRRPIAVDGKLLDSLRTCPPLNSVERARLAELHAKEKQRLAGACAKERELFVNRQSRRLAERTGIELHHARDIILHQCSGVLLPDLELAFDDPELAGTTVAEVLADPARFEGETLADPLEGIEYGAGKARIMRRADGSVWVHSFAHGRTTYELRLDFAAAKAALEKAGKDDAADMFVRLVFAAAFDDDEIEELRNIACNKTGITKTTMARKLKRAIAAARALRAEEERLRRLGARQDPRPLLPVPLLDAEYVPEMKTLNHVVALDTSPEPPTRNPNKVVAVARKIRVPSLHALTCTETNVENDPDQPSARTGAADLEAAE